MQPVQPVCGRLRALWTMQSVRTVQSLRGRLWAVWRLQPMRSRVQPLRAL